MSRRTDPARARNFASVLRETFASPGRSRKEIADAIGISAASVTSIAASLLDHQLIAEADAVAAGQGRPRVPLSVDSESNLVMGIHLGPRVTGVVLTGLDGISKASVLVPHAGLDAEASFALIIEQANLLIAEHAKGRQILGTGVATGGIVDRINGRIVENQGAGWSEVPAVSMLADLPQPLILDNNARAAAQSELFYGHGARESDFLLMVITSDLGAVLVSNGQIRAGWSQHAGNIAHLQVSDAGYPCACGRRGCLQVMATDEATVRRAHEAGRLDVKDYGDIDRLYDAGDEQIRSLVTERNGFVAHAAATVFDLLDPGLLVIAGTPAERPETLAGVQSVVASRSLQGPLAAQRVVYSSDHELSLSIFAASIMVNEVLSNPLSFIERMHAEAIRK
ncbi:hypothetical protein CQ010_01895 [Arthrobacter sp. MYb211]|uniref:ROK family protein n=1 Tax=Micrococcaceae TaxID=1268 RepID=UPI000CFCA0A5|nr:MULTISPECIES: ROK family protein [unclassified Arthrobacter]PQZ98205.1 hypothetical protein CQ017_11345 [Arthrobacter sp. MYb224]PRA02389.1 hypothetical protein CQ019_13045 [Arthrobacter sp. MYb229]PRA13422.1 hypothetical protein CQ015_04150 [Arthrobacter sp. MYb221]PRB50668.1 hypothetical protein CQ013_11780 [Arthrobacter sp. MYb216]PRC10620.1 hypothetical protein CQ010_01895 [Arthrobacter sp. MYb211]